MYHIIDADKLLEFVETGMRHSRLCEGTEPVTQNGEYDVEILRIQFLGEPCLIPQTM